MDSLRAAARAAVSPRVWAVVGTVTGWAFAAAVYVAGSARQSDLLDVKRKTEAAAVAAAEAKSSALEASRAQLQTHDAAALALQAIVGQLAYDRARGARAEVRDRERVAAERRFKASLVAGSTWADAATAALVQ